MGDNNTMAVLNTFFSNTVSNLKIEGYSNCNHLTRNISGPVLKCNVKYRDHSRIIAIVEIWNENRRLPFQRYKKTKS